MIDPSHRADASAQPPTPDEPRGARRRRRAADVRRTLAPVRLAFETTIRASRQYVARCMLDDAGFRRWTVAFCAGSHYRGGFDVGREIRFLDPRGNGTLGHVVAHWPAEILCLRHTASLRGHRRVAESPERDWAGCTEDWLFFGGDAWTRLRIEADIPPAHADALAATWPRALAALTALCERPPTRRGGAAGAERRVVAA